MADPDRLVRAGDLVGIWEIADRLGVAHVQTVHLWRRRKIGFPQPVAELHSFKVWVWPDVERWAHETGRLGPWSGR